MNYIIPDTNLFYGKFYLTGKEWRYLLQKHLEEDFITFTEVYIEDMEREIEGVM